MTQADDSMYDLDDHDDSPRDRGSPGKEPLLKLLEDVQELLEGQQRLERLLASGATMVGSPTKHHSAAAAGGPKQSAATCSTVQVDELPRRQSSGNVSSGGKSATLSRAVRLRPELEGGAEQFEQVCDAALAEIAELEEEIDDMAQNLPYTMALNFSRPVEKTMRMIGHARRCTCGSKLVWGPTSGLRSFADVLSLVFLSYDAFVLPFAIAFDLPMEGTLFYLAIVVVSFWIFDMLFRFRCSYFRSDGTLETNLGNIARHYLKTTWLLDFSIISVDIVCVVLAYWSSGAKSTETDALKVWRLGKVSRLARVASLLRMRAMPILLERLLLSQNRTLILLCDVTKLIWVIVWLNHIMACIWMPIGKMGGDGDTGLTWLDMDVGVSSGTSYRDTATAYQYTTALHWAISQMTPGSMQVFPVNSAERIYNCACLVFGLLVFSTLISSISGSVTQFKIAMQKQSDLLDTLNRFLRMGQISSELTMQVRQLVKEKLKYKKPLTIKDVELLELLPLSLQRELQVQIALPVLVSHGYFNFLLHADTPIFESLCSACAEPCVLGKQDTLFLQSTSARAMYFVKDGELRYTAECTRFSKTMTSTWRSRALSGAGSFRGSSHDLGVGERATGGEWLSEAALWCDWLHAGSAECLTTAPCEVMKVWTAKVLSVLTENQASLGTQLTFSYARSFASCLASCQEDLDSDPPTDLKLPFNMEEVIGAMPRKAKLLMGHVAINVIRTKTSGYSSYVGALTGSNARQVAKLRREVAAGKCMLILNRESRLGVNRVVALVVLKLWREEDGRQLVELKNTSDPIRASAKLPGAKQQEGEDPEQCLRRLLTEDLGPDLAEGVVREGKESTVEIDSSYQYGGIPTRYQKSIFMAVWDPKSPASATMNRRQPMGFVGADDAMPTASQETMDRINSGSFAPLSRENLITLASGHFGAWLTEEEIESFGSQAGRAELSRRLSSLPAKPDTVGQALAA